jgi:hydrogenase maturation protein HypF
VAAKGVGGFHLLADALDEAAVCRLRRRKRREAKPLAVMFPDLAALRSSCRVDAVAEALLTGPAGPIVLLRRAGTPIAEVVAPGCPRVGAFLPYSPMHHLLMDELACPIVATSGNATDEPIVISDEAALRRLAGIADLFLVHNRAILRPVDDSVAQVVVGEPQLLRSGRGYAPATIAVGKMAEGILAYGGHLKASIAASVDAGVVISQHLGDLGTESARDAYREARVDFEHQQEKAPRWAVCDLHPDYASSREAERSGIPVLPVPHHLAHVSACVAEHGIEPPVLGVAWDGAGHGPDGTIWGGEFLLLSDRSWRRVAHLRPFRLPGGEAAAREPRRSAIGLLHAAYGEAALSMDDLPAVASFTPSERATLTTMLERGLRSPLTTSMGRLFDAFAALGALRLRSSYEGQAAAELEWSAVDVETRRDYVFPLSKGPADVTTVDWQPALEAMLVDLRSATGIGPISVGLHEGLAAAIVEVAKHVGEERVALTGGCFQNARLTETAIRALRAEGFEPYWHRRVPPNDGGLSLGQAAWAARVMQDRVGRRNMGANACA